ncbi:PLP-dependent aminotransferase family protein [Streptomyces tendae]|uniref:hypothetical protein n=1 Tax=Streptomyces tendae TaxID=1932 RepID=UPI0037F27867
MKKMQALSNHNWDYALEEGVHGCVLEPSSGGLLRTPDDRSIVSMSSYSYLGLDEHPKIIAAAAAAVQRTGVLNSSLSRVRMTMPLLEEAEAELSDSCAAAAWATLPVLASGLLTGENPPVVVFDKGAHFCMLALKAACADETQVMTVPHNDMDALEEMFLNGGMIRYSPESSGTEANESASESPRWVGLDLQLHLGNRAHTEVVGHARTFLDLVRQIGYRGHVNIDGLVNTAGHIYFHEINGAPRTLASGSPRWTSAPRLSSSTLSTTRCGPVCTVICRRPGHWLHVSRAPSGRSPATGGRWTPKWSGWCQTSSPSCSGS